MKNLLLSIIMMSSMNLLAQKSDVISKLIEYGIASDALEHGLQDASAAYAFNFTTVFENNGKTDTEESHFDPKQPVGSKWILDSHNGNTPTKKELKNFDKAHNTNKDGINGKVDDASWKILTDDEVAFTVSFAFDKESLPKKFEFLGDCTGTAFFNKETKSLEKVVFVNNGPLKIKILKVSSLNMVITYINLDGKFLMETETLNMTVDMLGQIVPVKEVMTYSNYKK